MSVGFMLAGSVSSGQTTPGSGRPAADSVAIRDKTMPADDLPQERGAADGSSFKDILKKGEADPAPKLLPWREAETPARSGSARGYSSWRPLDLKYKADDQSGGRPGTEEKEEVAKVPETGLPLAISIHQAHLADEAPPAVRTDMPRGLAIAAATRAGAEAMPADAAAPARLPPGTVGASADAKEPQQRQRTIAVTDSKDANIPPVASRVRGDVATETGGMSKGAPEAVTSDRPPAIRNPAPATNPPAAEHSEAKVTILSSQTTPAPAAVISLPGPSPTGTAFVASLQTENALPQHAAEVASLALDQQSASSKPITTLKFQLHPAELGAVTVKLTGSGEQLTIEVQVESAEARHRLSTDSDAIVKALRGMGYDIDRITVQQAPSAAASQGGATNRENGFAAQDGRAQERQDQPSRRESGQQHDQNGRGNSASGSDRSQAGGSGVYI